MTLRPVRPWPGPRPYTTEDAHLFFGREKELGRLETLLLRNHLTLLLAVSGAGKTSLLQAGLLPRLWLRRSEDPRNVGLSLLVRSWSDVGTLSPPALLVRAIEKVIEHTYLEVIEGRNRALSADDVHAAYQVRVPEIELLNEPQAQLDSAVDYVSRLASATGGLILIIDQAEELLGSGLGRKDKTREALVLALFNAIHRVSDRCRLVISMREEFRARLSPLEVKGLEKRQILIEPLSVPVALTAIRKAAEAVEGVELVDDEEAPLLKILMSWLGDGSSTESGDLAQNLPVDLLRLQALLVAIFERARADAEAEGASSVVISHSTLTSYKSLLEQEALHRNESVDLRDLGRQALERYIDDVFQVNQGDDAMERADRLRYLVVRMTRWLSSPEGLKRHIPADELIYNALRDDLEGLGITNEATEVRHFISGKTDITLLRLNQSSENEAGEEDDGWDGDGASGFAWTFRPQQIISLLLDSSKEALDLLQRNYVLKASDGGEGPVYELVHDGFGPALYEWAEKQRRRFTDTLAAVVSRRGENFLWSHSLVAQRSLEHLRWLGCNVRSVTFSSVIFRQCDLRGTIFLKCSFEDCTFIGCNLDGCVFIGGHLSGGEWEDCTARSALFKGTTWRRQSTFKTCSIENSTFVENRLPGTVCFNDCSMRFCQVYAFAESRQESGGRVKMSRCDLTNALFEDIDAAIVDELSDLTGIIDNWKPPQFGPRE